MANLSQEEQLKLIADLEIEMMADMYNRYNLGYHVYTGCAKNDPNLHQI